MRGVKRIENKIHFQMYLSCREKCLKVLYGTYITPLSIPYLSVEAAILAFMIGA